MFGQTATFARAPLARVGVLIMIIAGAWPISARAVDFNAAIQAYDAGDYASALTGFRQFAVDGHVGAQYSLAVMYDRGQGVPRNYARAANWYRAAARQGHAGAQNNICVMYAEGEGVSRNLILAHMWCNLSATQNFPGATLNRDDLARSMSQAQIAVAQAMTHLCLITDYRECGIQ